MANPRKFSEKIALLNQKEAEGNAEFERIMREVSEVSAKGDEPATTLAGLLTTTGYSNDITKNGSAGDLKASSRESRGRSVGGGPMRARSRNIDTSPYSSNNTAYLSPPDPTWRRTSSDSAINQSSAHAQENSNVHNTLMLSPRAHKRLSSSQSNSMKNLHQQHNNLNQQHSNSQQNMPQNSFVQQNMHQQHHQQAMNQHLAMSSLQQDMKSRSHSRLPGINVYPSQNEDTLQIPVGNSTGSLPDLTLVHYQQSPLSTPLDLEHDQLIAVTSSSFNTSIAYSMPMTSSSNQLPNMGQHQLYHQINQQNASNNLENFSPKHYSNNGNGSTNNNSNNNGKVSSSSQGFQGNNNSTYTQQTSPIPIDTHQQQRQQQHSPLHHQSYPNNQITAEKMMSYRTANAASPANLSSSQGNLSKISYRNSPHSRPSPGSSPNNVPGLSANFDSNSSAPCSPSPLTTGNNGQFDTFTSVDSFYINPSIQQHFEQFSLDWTSLVQSLVDSGCTISAEVKVDSPLPDYITSTNDQNYQMNDNYNGMMDDSPNRQSSPTNRSSTPTRTNARTSSNNTNHMNHQTSNNNSSNSNHQTNNGTGSPHSPLSNDSMLSGGTNYDNMNCDNLRNNLIMGSSALDGALLNGVGSGNGINDIMLGGGLGSDSSSKLITSSSAALQTSLMMSQTSPSHHLNNTQTTNSIPEIIFSDYSSGSEFARDFLTVDNFLELGTTELQMFENANIIDPTIEDSFRRDLY